MPAPQARTRCRWLEFGATLDPREIEVNPMTVQPAPPTYQNPPTRAQLHAEACIDCGTTEGPLTPVGHVFTPGRERGSQLGWAVVACRRCAGGEQK
ncbi:hypothetical protein [Streptacidiphilus monticola]|uniref:Uncharacterized protein n=1 Tax=Streptacidiphilus monticola TaxID=2161674 RepID=A0ABW1G647_9ACTN